MPSTDLDLRQGRSLAPADLLELYREHLPTRPLLLAAATVANEVSPPGPELPWPFAEPRAAVLAAINRGQLADADSLAAGWLEATLAQPAGPAQALELVAASEAYALVLETTGAFSDAATALAMALRLHDRRRQLPFHGVLLRRASAELAELGAMDAGRLLAAEALRLAIETRNDVGAAYSLGSAARIAAHSREWQDALCSTAAAWRFLPEGEPMLRFALHLSETNAFLATGRLAEAEAALERTRASIAGLDEARAAGYLAWTEGRLHLASQRFEAAEAALTLALRTAKNTQDPLNWMLILLDLGEALEALGATAELRERCAELVRGLPALEKLEGGRAVVEAFRILCARLELGTQ